MLCYADVIAAIQAVLSSIVPVVRQRMAGGNRSYTPGQYAAAALLLLDSPHHAVSVKHMAQHLDSYVTPKKPDDKDHETKETGQKLLNSLLYYKTLTLRAYSPMAYDVPRDAFFSDDSMGTLPSTIVMFNSNTELVCLKMLRPELETALKQWEHELAQKKAQLPNADQQNARVYKDHNYQLVSIVRLFGLQVCNLTTRCSSRLC